MMWLDSVKISDIFLSKSSKRPLFSAQGNFSVNSKDLQAVTLVGPTMENPVYDPLAVQHLDNRLCIKLTYLSVYIIIIKRYETNLSLNL